jgi:hypothetical protein
MVELDLKDLARRGAVARLAELKAEAAAILLAFPELRRDVGVSYTADDTTILTNRRHRSKRKPMTTAQRRAIGLRMKRYWAGRRNARERN